MIQYAMYILSVSIEKKDSDRDGMVNAVNKIDQMGLRHYANTCRDVRRCPKGGCSGAGFISQSAFSEQLKCDICQTQWKELIQYTQWDLVKGAL